MAETSADVIKRYLEDAIAAEKSFETQLQGFSKEGDNEAAKALFQQHALETRVTVGVDMMIEEMVGHALFYPLSPLAGRADSIFAFRDSRRLRLPRPSRTSACPC
jgi:hypothetical protein